MSFVWHGNINQFRNKIFWFWPVWKYRFWDWTQNRKHSTTISLSNKQIRKKILVQNPGYIPVCFTSVFVCVTVLLVLVTIPVLSVLVCHLPLFYLFMQKGLVCCLSVRCNVLIDLWKLINMYRYNAAKSLIVYILLPPDVTVLRSCVAVYRLLLKLKFSHAFFQSSPFLLQFLMSALQCFRLDPGFLC